MDRRASATRTHSGPQWVAEIYDQLVDDVSAGGRAVVHLDPPRLVVAAPDQRGLLVSVVGTLALHGLDIRRSDVTGRDGVAIDSFTVDAVGASWPDAERLRDDLEAALSGRLELAERIASRSRDDADTRPAPNRSGGPIIVIDNSESDTCTLIEVHTTDALGLLYRLTRALFECELDVVSARVSTFGNAASDAFYVRTATTRKVAGAEAIEAVKRALTDSLP
jgi:[protein-PII] uridylyltransferase